MEKQAFLKTIDDALQDLKDAEGEMFDGSMTLLNAYKVLERGLNPEEKQHVLHVIITLLKASNFLAKLLIEKGDD